jgi:coproporphyrinogen III oxidase
MEDRPQDNSISVDEIEAEFRKVQDVICEFLQRESGQAYQEDRWNYEKGKGGGITRVWEENLLFQSPPDAKLPLLEKGGVNFSGIEGASMPDSAATLFKIPTNTPYRATGVSLVIHPYSPHVPTIHFNIRYFECGPRWWFGGGVDVTPYYVNPANVISFHKKLKQLCEKWGHDYNVIKKQCDEYFFLKHRNEARGVGGLFFDHLTNSSTHETTTTTTTASPPPDISSSTSSSTSSSSSSSPSTSDSKSKKELCCFVVELGLLFPDLYAPFIHEGKDKSVTEEQKQFHWYRRSRYVEFNLLYDRGTRFGLQSEGRIESIMMSMPPTVKWKYNWSPKEGSPESQLLEIIKPKDWANMQ